MCNSVLFSVLTELCNCHHYLSLGYFPQPPKKPCAPWQSLPTPPQPPAPGNYQFTFCVDRSACPGYFIYKDSNTVCQRVAFDVKNRLSSNILEMHDRKIASCQIWTQIRRGFIQRDYFNRENSWVSETYKSLKIKQKKLFFYGEEINRPQQKLSKGSWTSKAA